MFDSITFPKVVKYCDDETIIAMLYLNKRIYRHCMRYIDKIFCEPCNFLASCALDIRRSFYIGYIENEMYQLSKNNKIIVLSKFIRVHKPMIEKNAWNRALEGACEANNRKLCQFM